MARPTKLTPAVHGKILGHLRAGAYLAHAAEAAGIHRDTVAEWVKRGEETEDEPYASFAADVREAQADDACEAIKAIREAQVDDWKAAAWRLERKFPKMFGALTKHEVSGKDGGPVAVSWAELVESTTEEG